MESATAALEGTVKLDVSRVRDIPKVVKLLDHLPAVSVGMQPGAEMTLESMRPSESEVFAVRGEMEEGELDQVDGPLDGGARVFAFPPTVSHP